MIEGRLLDLVSLVAAIDFSSVRCSGRLPLGFGPGRSVLLGGTLSGGSRSVKRVILGGTLGVAGPPGQSHWVDVRLPDLLRRSLPHTLGACQACLPACLAPVLLG